MMRNIPKYYTTRNLLSGKILKFDIKNPDPGKQLWNRTNRTQWNEDRNETQECIIETEQEIQARKAKTTIEGKLKRTIQQEQPREAHNEKQTKEKDMNPQFQRMEKENEKEKPLPGIEPGPLPPRNGASLPLDHRDN